MGENTTSTDATLTEHLPATDNYDDSIEGAAKITHVVDGRGLWTPDDGESVDEVRNYGVECSCGETFDTWGKATAHVDEQH